MTQQAEWFLPLAGQVPSTQKPPYLVEFPSKDGNPHSAYQVRTLGAPIHRDEIAQPMSAEANAVLVEAHIYGRELCAGRKGNVDAVCVTAMAYARSLAPPDPVAEARRHIEALKARVMTDADGVSHALCALAALDKIGAKP